MTLYIGGFSRVVAFPTAPIATGRSDPCRKGLAPSREPCLSTAHDFITTTPELKFSVHTRVPCRSISRAGVPSVADTLDAPPKHNRGEVREYQMPIR